MNRVFLNTTVSFFALSLATAGCGRNKSGAGDDGEQPEPTPAYVLDVTVSPNPADKGQVVTIDASSSAGDFAYFSFDFGDGTPLLVQDSPVATHAYDVINFQDTAYTVHVKGFFDNVRFHEADENLLVRDLPPQVDNIDVGPDAKAVIGEWIHVTGSNFLAEPAILVDGIAATTLDLIDESNLRFRVPPRVAAGGRDVQIVFEHYDTFEGKLDVKRFAVATSARHDKVYLMDVAKDETVTDTGIRIDLADASTVKVSGDGSTAYVTDGRFNFVASGRISIIDLTADGGPALAGEVAGVGNGPLYDIEAAAEAPVLVAGDAFGITVFDIRDPLAPVKIGYTSALFAGDPVNDVAAVDMAISRDGSTVVALNAFNAQARIFHLNGYQVMNATTPTRIDVGPRTQDAVISDDGTTLYVLGGGGEGAVPLDISDPRAANLSAIDLGGEVMASGPYKLSDLNGTEPVAPIPFDLAVSRTDPGRAYVTTLDEGFTEFFSLLSDVFTDPTWENLLELIVFLEADGLNLGKTVPVLGADTLVPTLGAPMQESFTAPTSADLLYSDRRMVQSSFRVWYDSNTGNFVFETGVTDVNLQVGNVSTYLPLTSETLSIEALYGLFQPPFSFGDVVFQP